MKTIILLFFLLASAQSLPKQLNPAMGLPQAKLVPDQAALLNQQQPNQVFPSLGLIPLTQMFTLGTDLHLLNPSTGMAAGTQALPLALGALTVQQNLQSQMVPIIVAHVGAQGAILSSEELPMTPQIFTGLLLQSLFPGSILPNNQAGATPEVQEGTFPAGQAGVNPAIQRKFEGQLSTPSGIDDMFGLTTPAGLQRSMYTTEEETTTESPNGIQ
ncbi:amelotin [Rhynchocyon petersi]